MDQPLGICAKTLMVLCTWKILNHDNNTVTFLLGRCLSDNFYVRGDGTRVYFFTQGTIKGFYSLHLQCFVCVSVCVCAKKYEFVFLFQMSFIVCLLRQALKKCRTLWTDGYRWTEANNSPCTGCGSSASIAGLQLRLLRLMTEAQNTTTAKTSHILGVWVDLFLNI